MTLACSSRRRAQQRMEISTKTRRQQVRGHNMRKSLHQMLPILLAVTAPLMAWKSLCILTASNFPVMCVVSESMAPAFHRGDLIFLSNRPTHVQVGDIAVIWFADQPLPMVHRAIEIFHDYTDDGHGGHARFVACASSVSSLALIASNLHCLGH
jgi:hypothetical protein